MEKLKPFWQDFKIFLRYLFDYDTLSSSIKSERTWYYLSFLLFAYFLFFSQSKNKIIYAEISFVIWVILSWVRVYMTGEHRAWNRKRVGMIKPKKLKEEQNERRINVENEGSTDSGDKVV